MARHSEVNFHLKPQDGNGLSIIYLQFLYSKQRLYFSFGEKVKPADWNLNKQRAKNKNAATVAGSHALNDLLDKLEEVCLDAYRIEKVNGIPTVETLKKYLKDFLKRNITAVEDRKIESNNPYNLIERFEKNEIKYKGKNRSPNTLDNYHALKEHLKNFESKKKFKVDFESITLDFFYKYVGYLQNDLGLKINTVAKDISVLKAVMGEAVDLGYTTNLQFKHKKFTVSEEEVDAVSLAEKEIIDIHRFDFDGNKRLSQVRDLFVFGCFTGLRFSDYSDVKPNNIVNIDGELFIKLITKKTNELVIIPCNPVILEIFNRYADNINRLPKALSNQKFNEYVKEVCKLAGIVEKGRLANEPNKELWECVTSHTARRSFATNYYLEGFPVIDLMKITGHKTEKAFLKYIKVTKLDSAKRLSLHIKKRNWGQLMMRVA